MKTLIILASFFLVSCSHFSNSQTKRDVFKKVALSIVVGGIYGSTLKENKKKNVLLFSSLLGLGVGVYGLYHLDESKQLKVLKKQLSELKETKGLTFLGKNKALLQQGEVPFYKKGLPSHLKHLVVPSEWSLYELEEEIGGKEWIQVEVLKVLKGNRLFELKPSKINPYLRKEMK